MTQRRTFRAQALGLLAIPVAAALGLTGCSNSSGAADGNVEISFTYATSNTLQNPYEVLVEKYMDENPDVTITLNPQPNDKYGETTRTQIQAGNASDVIQTSPGEGQGQSVVSLGEAGFLEPLGDTAKNLVPAEDESLFSVDGTIYGQPLDFTVNSIVVNETTVDSVGLDSFPASEKDLLASCGSLSAEGKSLIVMAGAAGPNAGLTAQAISATRVYQDDPQWNKKRANGEVTFAGSEGWKDTLQAILDMQEAGCFQPGAEGAGFDAITNGLAQGSAVSSFIPGGSAVEIGRTAADQKWGIHPFPAKDGGTSYVLASSNYALSVNAASKNKDAAQAFVEWMGQPAQSLEFADLSGQLPVTGVDDYDFSGSIYAPVEDALKAGNYATLPNALWPNPKVYDALATGVQGLLTAQLDIAKVLESMDAAWDS